ncbi:hypothetical protein D3C87_2182380 [compost metagenome]
MVIILTDQLFQHLPDVRLQFLILYIPRSGISTRTNERDLGPKYNAILVTKVIKMLVMRIMR